MIDKRETHCAFAVLNRYGKCIAYCHRTLGLGKADCIGREDPSHKQILADIDHDNKLH